MFRKVIDFFYRMFSKKEEIRKQYSLDEYLDTISLFTDDVIRNEERRKRFFTGGDCQVKYIEPGHVRIYIRMYFIDRNKDRYLKESERRVRIQCFDKPSQEHIKKRNRTYEIHSPRSV